MLQAAAERVPFRMFFGRLLTAKLDPRDLRNLHDALHGDDGQKLLLYYQDFLRIGFTGIDGDKLLKMDMLASRYRLHIEQFDSAIAQALGICSMTIDDIPMEFTESPAAEEAAVRDEEAAQFMKFGVNGPGFIIV